MLKIPRFQIRTLMLIVAACSLPIAGAAYLARRGGIEGLDPEVVPGLIPLAVVVGLVFVAGGRRKWIEERRRRGSGR